MNVEDLKKKQHQLEVQYNQIQQEVRLKQEELNRLQGEWRAYEELIKNAEEADNATTVVAKEDKDAK